MRSYLHQHPEELCEPSLHDCLHQALLIGSHHPMNVLPKVGLAVTTMKHSRKSCSAPVVMNMSSSVHKCSLEVGMALLQDSHHPVKVVPVEELVRRSLKRSKKSPHSPHQLWHQTFSLTGQTLACGTTRDWSCSDKLESLRDSMPVLSLVG